MPFSDDEQLIDDSNEVWSTWVFALSAVLWVTGLFFPAVYRKEECLTGGVLFFGVEHATDPSIIVWLANPCLWCCWLALWNDFKHSWVPASAATLLATWLAMNDVPLRSFDGQQFIATQFATGYWLWVSSCIIALLGSLAVLIQRTQRISTLYK
jgi:hypothetical protein